MDLVKFFTNDTGSNPVRIVGTMDNPLFVTTDLGMLLQLTNIRVLLASFDDDEKTYTTIQTKGGMQKVNCVTEQGLYRLIFTSRVPFAKSFRSWVTGVIRELRTQGTVTLQESLKKLTNNVANTISTSKSLLEKYKYKPVFYIMKIADLPQGEQVFKLGQTHGNLMNRLNVHSREYRAYTTNEGSITLTQVWECTNPFDVENAVKKQVFPQHTFKCDNRAGNKTANELVLVNKEFTLSDLFEIVQTCVDEYECKRDVIIELNSKIDYLQNLLVRKDHEIACLHFRSSSEPKLLLEASTQTDPEKQTHHQTKEEVILVTHKRTNRETKPIQQIDPDSLVVLQVYDAMADLLQNHVQLTRSMVQNAIKDKIKTGGFFWQYVPDKENIMDTKNFVPHVTTKPTIEPIARLDKNMKTIEHVYATQLLICEEHNIKPCQVYMTIRKERKYKGLYYIKWSRVPEALRQDWLNRNQDIVCHKDMTWTIATCVKTNKVFEHRGTPTDVARRLRYDCKGVEQSCKDGQPYLGYIYKKETRATPIHVHDLNTSIQS